MTPTPDAELLDLRGQPSADQMRQAQVAVEWAEEGPLTVITDLEVVPKYLIPAAAERGLHCRLEPPGDGEWRLTLTPQDILMNEEGEA